MRNKIIIFLTILLIISMVALIYYNSKKRAKEIEIIKKVEQNKFYFEKRVRGVKKFSVRGDKFLIGKDQKLYINGNVKTELFTGGKKIEIFSASMMSSPDFKKVVFSGTVRVKSENNILEGKEIIYNIKVIRSNLPVKVIGENFSFNAKDFFYRIDKDFFVFRNLKNFTIKKDKSTYNIKAKNLFFYNNRKILKLVGTPIEITKKEQNEFLIVKMPILYLSFTQNNKLFDGITRNLSINETLTEKNQKGEKQETFKKININKVRLFFYDNTITEIVGSKGGRAIIGNNEKREIIIFSSGRIKFNNNRIKETLFLEGRLKTIEANKNFKGKGSAAYLTITFKKDKKIKTIKAKDKTIVFIKDRKFNLSCKEGYFNLKDEQYKIYNNATFYNKKDFFISAEKILIKDKNKFIKASEKVTGYLRKGKLNFMCNSFFKNKERIIFKGNVFIKSDDGEIGGEEVKIEKNNFLEIKKGKISKDNITIKGNLIKKDKSKITIKGNVVFKKDKNLKVKGEEAEILIKNKKYTKVLIKNSIKINFDEGKGESEYAEINLEKKIVYLKGKAKFEDKKGTKIEGEKLTLNLENGKIYATSKINKKVKVIIKEE